MADTTYEEAKRCPKCHNPGEQVRDVAAPPPTIGRLHLFRCRNERCEWFETDWPVQVRPDGTVVQPDDHKGPKRYPEFTPGMESRGLAIVEDAVGRDLRDSREI